MARYKTSVIIPSRGEIFLKKTVDDLFSKDGDFQVVVVLDGYWPEPEDMPKDNAKLTIIHLSNSKGMRNAINIAANISSAENLMKIDAHCLFAEGWNDALTATMEDNWIVIPSRFSLDAENWCILNNGKPRRDYHYLCYPDPSKEHDGGMHGVEWWERGRQRLDPKYDIDDTMSFQGSCWFMRKSWFTDFLGGMNEEGYGTFSQEPQEIGNKTWLGGGELKVNKKTYYAHLHKGKQYGRMYHINQREIVEGHNYSANYWMMNKWNGRIHDIDWLIDRFWPVPTWPENWRDIYYKNGHVEVSGE